MIGMPLFTEMLLLAAAVPAFLLLIVVMSGKSMRDEDESPVTNINPSGFYHSPLLSKRLRDEMARREAATTHTSTQCACKAVSIDPDRASGEFWPEIPPKQDDNPVERSLWDAAQKNLLEIRRNAA